jgi:signal transduction histidine kinase
MEIPKNSARLLAVLGGLGLQVWTLLGAAEAPAEPLTTAAAVLSLNATQASQRLQVAVTGVVTAAEPDWRGQFFLQDATGGVFVENYNQASPVPGDVVELTGVSHPGAFAPIVSAPHWRKLGTAPLPEAKPVLIENLMSGVEDGQRIEVTGIVRTARLEEGWLVMDLAVNGYRLQIFARRPSEVQPAALIAARVLVRGTAAAHYNTALRHLTSVAVYAPRLEDFIVLEAEQADPFAQPVQPVTSVAEYRRNRSLNRRVHVRGTVTWQKVGDHLFLQDESGGIRVESPQPKAFAHGDTVDAIGFIDFDNRLPLLRDALLQRSASPAVPVTARAVPFSEIQVGRHYGELIRLQGKVVDRASRVAEGPDGRGGTAVTTWLLQNPETTFSVEYEGAPGEPAPAIAPVGSTVEAEGVGISNVDAATTGTNMTIRLLSLKVLLRTPADLRVLARPSWLTPERLLAGIGLLTLGLIISGTWLLTVAKKNAALRQLIHEKEQAQRELQEAHDTLEQKVIERSAQLQTEMTAKKTAEVQFKAVLMERTRLARDLHDTLEQTLTGIALHLDTAAKILERDPASSNRHFQLARNWLRQSQVGLRGSIWDLRSRELEQFDLASALRHSAEQLVDGTAMQLEFGSRGEKRALPEVVEENVLRIGQEALTNIGKHAQASRVGITVEFSPQSLLLKVEDNGVGFAHAPSSPPGDNHFGLLGMSERAKRLGGRVVIASRPGQGTSVLVEVPLDSTDAAGHPVAVEREPYVI